MNPLVSIIIPVYNQEKRLARCIDSVLNQTYSNIEILCVDDASTDASASILENYKKKDTRVKLFTHNINKNAGGARNTAIANSCGEYLYFLDSDDWLLETAIEDLVNSSRDASIDIVSAPITIHDNAGNSYIEPHPSNMITKEELIKYGFLEGVRMLGCLFRSKIFHQYKIMYPEDIFYEDNSIYSLLFLYANTFLLIEKSSYQMDISNMNSSSRQSDIKHAYDRIKSTDLFRENLIIHGFYEKYRQLIDYRYMSLSVYTYILIADSLPWFDACVNIYRLRKKLYTILSTNEYVLSMSSYDISILKRPWLFLTKVRCKQMRIKLHVVRHNIVTYVKILIGKDPKKSFFS